MGFYIRISIVVGTVLAFALFVVCFSAPFSFPKKLLIQVHVGETGQDIASNLKADHAIRFETIFKILLRLYGTETAIPAGTYYFPSAENAFQIVWRLHVGDFGLEPIRVVIPEGTDTKEMAVLLSADVPGFNSSQFLTEAEPKEGYLFPDTYFIFPGEDTGEIVSAMEANFNAHVNQLSVTGAVAASGKPFASIITMASLLEKEAPDTQDREIISGILWKRISLGMPLDVDAVFPYITGKTNGDITHADLQIDSPYNTYLNKGLPPGPITNPGLDSIMAAATPTTTPYLYYLSDKKGNFHYSATYAGQLANERKYLQ